MKNIYLIIKLCIVNNLYNFQILIDIYIKAINNINANRISIFEDNLSSNIFDINVASNFFSLYV